MSEHADYLKELIEKGDTEQLAIGLHVIGDGSDGQHATGEPEVMDLLESLLNDRRLCLIGIPYIFGEIRWLAAFALAYERTKAGIKTPVEVQVVLPMTPIEIGRLADEYGIKGNNPIDRLRQLIELNVAPMKDIKVTR